MVVNLCFFSVVNSLVVYYVVSVGTGLIAAVFIVQSIRPYFKDIEDMQSDVSYKSFNPDEPMRIKQIFLGVVGVTQILFIQLMGRYTSV